MTNTDSPSLKRLGQATASLALSHIELLGIELQEEKSRWTRIVLLTAISMLSGLMLLFSAATWVVIYFWDTYRLAAAGGVVVFFVLLLALCLWRLSHHLSQSSNAFSATREELARHRELLP